MFELTFWTGARISDVIRLGEGNVTREGWLTFVQMKTGGEVSIPFQRDLPDFVESMAADFALLQAAIAAHHLPDDTQGRRSLAEGRLAVVLVEGPGGRDPRENRPRPAQIAHHGTDRSGGDDASGRGLDGHESLSEIERYGRAFNRKKALSKTKTERQSSNFSD